LRTKIVKLIQNEIAFRTYRNKTLGIYVRIEIPLLDWNVNPDIAIDPVISRGDIPEGNYGFVFGVRDEAHPNTPSKRLEPGDILIDDEHIEIALSGERSWLERRDKVTIDTSPSGGITISPEPKELRLVDGELTEKI